MQQQFDKWSEFVAYFSSLEWDQSDDETETPTRKAVDDFELVDDFGASFVGHGHQEEFEMVSSNKKQDLRPVNAKVEKIQ